MAVGEKSIFLVLQSVPMDLNARYLLFSTSAFFCDGYIMSIRYCRRFSDPAALVLSQKTGLSSAISSLFVDDHEILCQVIGMEIIHETERILEIQVDPLRRCKSSF
jgi:hypothetical protein